MAPRKSGASGKNADGLAARPKLRLVRPTGAPAEVYEIKITLLDTRPPIWRRFAVPADIRLPKLHDVIQVVMGWYNEHLHQFITADRVCYGPRDPDDDWDLDLLDERGIKLSTVAPGKGARLLYEYDFGDGWRHRLVVLKTMPAQPGVRYPVCLAGARACPPEDCGGVWGYAELLDALADPRHERHDELLEWMGGPFDPEHFDLDAVNEELRSLR